MEQLRQQEPPKPGERTFTEGETAEELGLDKLELHLAAAAQRLGRYDPLTHLLVFSDAEVDELAARLGIKRRRREDPGDADKAKIPEPSEE